MDCCFDKNVSETNQSSLSILLWCISLEHFAQWDTVWKFIIRYYLRQSSLSNLPDIVRFIEVICTMYNFAAETYLVTRLKVHEFQ